MMEREMREGNREGKKREGSLIRREEDIEGAERVIDRDWERVRREANIEKREGAEGGIDIAGESLRN